LSISLYEDAGYIFSEPLIIEGSTFHSPTQQKEFLFTGIPIKKLVTQNMCLIFKLIEVKAGTKPSALKAIPSLGITK
jgi:hypothetical protein